MTRLNDHACRVALAAGATGATDVTGFGLLGHLGRAAAESGVDVTIEVDRVPFLPGVRLLAEAGMIPGGSQRNLAHVEPDLDRGDVDDLCAVMLADAQTSGGLVFGVDPAAAGDVVAELVALGHTAAVIGSTRTGNGRIRLL
jgi:selenide, water dikinase